MRSGMPLYRNHFRRSRDAPEVLCDLLHSNSREANRQDIDAGDEARDSNVRFLHPVGGEIIQTFCSPVSLIPVARMAELVSAVTVIEFRPRSLRCFDLMLRASMDGCCCLETIA